MPILGQVRLVTEREHKNHSAGARNTLYTWYWDIENELDCTEPKWGGHYVARSDWARK